jgi:hypothetical protein
MATKTARSRIKPLGFAPLAIAGGRALLPALLSALATATPYVLAKLRKVDFTKVAKDAEAAKGLYKDIKAWKKEEKKLAGLGGVDDIAPGQAIKWALLGLATIWGLRKFVRAGADSRNAREATSVTAPAVTNGLNAAMAAREMRRLLHEWNINEDRVFALLRGLQSRRNFNLLDAEYRRAFAVPLLRDLERVKAGPWDADYDTAMDIINSLSTR